MTTLVKLRYVITGCAGSGTGWASRIMTGLGSSCGHENVYGFHTDPPPLGVEGDSAWEAIGRLPVDIPILLLVRNPLHVVRSETALNYFLRASSRKHQFPRNDRYLRQVLPQVRGARDRLGGILRYVAYWDADVDQISNVEAHRLEDVDTPRMVAIYRRLAGREPSADPGTVLAGVGTSFNTHGGVKSNLTWDDVRAHPDGALVIEKAKRWGYL